MIVTVDHDVCELNALCVATAPEVFAIGDDDLVHVTQPTTPANEELARQAVVNCPTSAISIVE